MDEGDGPRAQAPPSPEARRVSSGETLHLCTCQHSPHPPDCPPSCAAGLRLAVTRPRILLLCRCGRSARLPYCDGSHVPAGLSGRARLRRFLTGEP